MQNATKKITRAGIVGGLYVILSLITFPVASSGIQFRASEALTLLPLFFPETIFGVFVGCALSNLITGCLLWDIILGSLVTLISAVITFGVGKIFKNSALRIIFGGLAPVLLNAFILPVVWLLCYGNLEYVYLLQALFLLVGQSLSVYGLGTPVYLSVKSLKDKGFSGFID